MTPANARALAEVIPGARLWVLEGAGHLVFAGRFADVNREVVRFLKEPRRRADRKTPKGRKGFRDGGSRGRLRSLAAAVRGLAGRAGIA